MSKLSSGKHWAERPTNTIHPSALSFQGEVKSPQKEEPGGSMGSESKWRTSSESLSVTFQGCETNAMTESNFREKSFIWLMVPEC